MDPAEKPKTTSAAGGGSRVISKEPEKNPERTSAGTVPEEKPQTSSAGGGGTLKPPPLDCIKCFDALWFCYSPFHQMQQYYRYGDFDSCFSKWGALVDCLSLKTKRKEDVEKILIEREKAKPHIWTYRTVDEATENWWRMYKHKVMLSKRGDSAAPPPKSGGAS